MAAKNENTDGADVSARPSTRAAAVPVGRFLRVLVVEDSAGGAVAGGVWRAPCPRTGGTWRQRAGVQQLPADMLLTLHEGYQRAFAVGDLDILREPAPAQTAVLCKEEAWLECARRDAHFPFLLAAYQHFSRAGWRVSSGLKYGATFLLYTADTPRRQREGSSEARDAESGSQHGHAPFAVYVLLPRGLHKRGTGLLLPTMRKRRHSGEAAPDSADDGGRGSADDDGAEASEDWTAIQSFTRLAAHVSKRFILAYTSYTPAFGDGAPAGGGNGGAAGDGNRQGGEDGGNSGAEQKTSCGRRVRGIETPDDMHRISIRELHLNRALT
jgi:hypothetical protein